MMKWPRGENVAVLQIPSKYERNCCGFSLLLEVCLAAVPQNLGMTPRCPGLPQNPQPGDTKKCILWPWLAAEVLWWHLLQANRKMCLVSWSIVDMQSALIPMQVPLILNFLQWSGTNSVIFSPIAGILRKTFKKKFKVKTDLSLGEKSQWLLFNDEECFYLSFKHNLLERG